MAKEEMKFEEKLNELEKMVNELEQGEVSLDDAIDKYTKAMKLAKECSEKLKNAEENVNKILTENGKEEDLKTVELYVKPEENTTYYVINGSITGSFFI